MCCHVVILAGFPISATQDLNLLIPDGMVTLAEVRCSGMEQSLSECTLNLIFEAENGNQAAIKCIGECGNDQNMHTNTLTQ